METIHILGAVIAIVVVMMLLLAMKSAMYPYQPAGPLLTKAELNFFRQLHPCIPNGTYLSCKVRIGDVVSVKDSIKSKKQRKRLFNQVAFKHFDFVLTDGEFNVLAAIELNDKSHEERERIERDKLVRKVMASANIPLIEVPAARRYDQGDLRQRIAVALQQPGINGAPEQTTQPI